MTAYFQQGFSNRFLVRILRALPDQKENNRITIFRKIFSMDFQWRFFQNPSENLCWCCWFSHKMLKTIFWGYWKLTVGNVPTGSQPQPLLLFILFVACATYEKGRRPRFLRIDSQGLGCWKPDRGGCGGPGRTAGQRPQRDRLTAWPSRNCVYDIFLEGHAVGCRPIAFVSA